MRIGLFITCVNDTAFPQTGQAVVRLLERLGHRVEFPAAQTCCGQMHWNTGYRAQAEPLIRSFAEVFADFDAVVTPSGSCAAMVRDQHPKVVGDRVPPLYDLSELLIDVLGVEDVGGYYPYKVTYHPTCHGLRMLKLGDRPLRLLRAVRGLELVELPGAEECCGFGGTFAMKNSAVSAAMGADKVANVLSTGAETLCAADNSCLMHIAGMLARRGDNVRVRHLAEILATTEAAFE
jgi:L-lactate dehydrogenase complex protein LldE